MANNQNLIPNSKRTPEELREITRKGGIASGKARREKKELKAIVEALFERMYETEGGEKISGAEAITVKQMEKALKGDTKAFEVLRDTAGQKPVEKVEQINIDAEYESRINELKEIFANGKADKRDKK